MNRRYRTIILGAVPVVALSALVSIDHIPGTDIRLAVPYAAEGPGPSFNTLGEVEGVEVVDIEGAQTDETKGNLNMTTVSVRSQMTLAQALGRWLFTDDTIVPIEQIFPPGLSEDEVRESNQVAFSTSEANATVAALNYLDKPLAVSVAGIQPGSAAEGELNEGDILKEIGGEKVETPGQVREIVGKRDPGDEINLTVNRGDKDLDFTIALGESEQESGRAQLGVMMASTSADGIKVDYNLQDIGGPSAGLMFSLAVVDKLSEGALNGGRFVAGTGTIDESGQVGPIGGIEHKARAARDLGAELFLAPQGNCSELRGQDLGDMTVAKVDTITDAVDAMEAFASGDEVETCPGT